MKIEGFATYLALNTKYPLTEDIYGCFACFKQDDFGLAVDVSDPKLLVIWEFVLGRGYKSIICYPGKSIANNIKKPLQLTALGLEVQEVIWHYWTWLDSE